MSINIASILSIIHPEPSLVQMSSLCFNSSYALFKSNLWFITVIGSVVLRCLIIIS